MKEEDASEGSDPSLLWRTAAVMRKRRDILDALDVHARGLQRGDRALTAAARTLDANLEFLDAKLGGLFGGLLGSTLAGEGRALAAPLETAGSTTRPAERIAPSVGEVTVVLLKLATT